MKSIKLLSLCILAVGMLMASCKSDGNTDTTLATTNTETATPVNSVNPGATPAKPAAPAIPTGPTTVMTFDDTTHDFGEVMEGDKVEYAYKFKNTGSEPLIISNAKGSCGCTVPEWPKEPIPVGGSSEILVRFDSKGKGKVGGNPQTKTVTITANTDPVDTRLYIKGKVNKEETAG